MDKTQELKKVLPTIQDSINLKKASEIKLWWGLRKAMFWNLLKKITRLKKWAVADRIMNTGGEITVRRRILQDQIALLERRYPEPVRREAVQALKERLKKLNNKAEHGFQT